MQIQILGNAQTVAELLGADLRTIHRRTVRGDLPVLGKLPGRTGSYVYDLEAIRAVHEQAG